MNRIRSKKRRMIWIGGLSILVLGAAGALGYYKWFKKDDDEGLKTFHVERKDIAKILYLSGRVRPKSSMVVTPTSSGHIVELLVLEGSKVKSGDPLFTMRLESQGQDELLRLRAEVRNFELEESAMTMRLEEKRGVEELLAGGSLRDERSALEKVRNQLRTARERLEVVERDLGLARGVPSGKGERSLVTIHAPEDGIITLVDKQPGDFVPGGARNMVASADESIVMILADMSSLQVRTKVLEGDLRQIKLGQEVKVRLDAYPADLLTGAVTHVGGQGRIDKAAGYTFFDVDITLKNHDGRVLPEMNANVEITVESKRKVLVLPLAAVAIFPKSAFVRPVVRGKDEEASDFEAIRTGIVNESDVEVLSGIKEKAEVYAIDFAELPLDEKELMKDNKDSGGKKSSDSQAKGEKKGRGHG